MRGEGKGREEREGGGKGHEPPLFGGSLRLCTQGARSLGHGSHSVTCNYTNACLYLVSCIYAICKTRWRLPRLRLRISNCSLLLINLPRKDERLSRPGWLAYSGRFTHISGHPSAAGRAQGMERPTFYQLCTQPTRYCIPQIPQPIGNNQHPPIPSNICQPRVYRHSTLHELKVFSHSSACTYKILSGPKFV